MTIPEQIQQAIKNPFVQGLRNEPDFYFQKGHDVLMKWINYNVSDILREKLLLLADKYDEIQKQALNDPDLKDVLELLFEIISYCDTKAKDKNHYNQYEDKRALAMAYVRMNYWIEKLILFKFKTEQVSAGSPLNAFNYLLDPEHNSTILSENHREMISNKLFGRAYDRKLFNSHLCDFFSMYSLVCSNPKNYTFLLSCIIYTIDSEWLDDIIGLMASDNTAWKDNLLDDMGSEGFGIIWNSKRPSGTNDTLKLLRNKINDEGYFKLFYSEYGNVTYVAEVVDFVENDKQYKKANWQNKYPDIRWIKKSFDEYVDGNKSASIVFLARKFYKIPPVALAEYKLYRNYSYPRHDNLTPIVSEPNTDLTYGTYDIKKDIEMNQQLKRHPNQILYGPPGTGKTYKLQQLIHTWGLTKTAVSEKDYTSFVKNVTWWQVIALAFLDIKTAKVPDLAKHPLIVAKLGSSNIKSLKTRLWSSLQHHCVDHCENVKLAKRIGEKVFYKDADSIWRLENADVFRMEYIELVESYQEFKTSGDSKNKDYTFTTCHQSLSYEDFIEGIKPDLDRDVSDDSEEHATVTYRVRKGTFYNACDKAAQKAGFINLQDCLDSKKEIRKEQFTMALANNDIHVIFLDEINRCNVSGVFGELITLLEEDKRLGNENEITDVLLPYSQDAFGVPANLFIVGTMNTADRSVEALDTALRRRFCFEEMMPDIRVVQDKNFSDYPRKEIMEKINNRVEVLLDRNYTLGHAYFIKENFVNSFKNEIIPLLQEYFYNDFGKIGLVLGKGFVREKSITKSNDIFADFDTRNEVDVTKGYEMIPLGDEFDFDSAIKTLLA